MGRNQDLRRKIAGPRKTIEEQEEKMRRERMKPDRNEEHIAHGRGEIRGLKKRVAILTRCLKREW